jgi:O-methyltransferase involved in polyketide biosynthesis
MMTTSAGTQHAESVGSTAERHELHRAREGDEPEEDGAHLPNDHRARGMVTMALLQMNMS